MRKVSHCLLALLSTAVSSRAQPTAKQELGFTERGSGAVFSFLLSRAAVFYQHVDLSAAVQRRVHTEGKEKGLLFSFFLDLTCSLAWLWENWASLSTTGFTVMMGREEPSHKGAE